VGISVKFTQVKVQNVFSAVQEQIKAMIASGDLDPGERLPSEPELAAQLGVGRSAVREALASLQAAGLIERSRLGTFVRPAGANLLEGPIEYLLMASPSTYGELLECRQVLELAGIGLAVERYTPGDLAEIKYHLDGAASAAVAGDHDGFVDANFQFHRHIVGAAHNSILSLLYDNLTRPIKHVLAKASASPGAIDESVRQHSAIYQSIVARDAESARLHVSAHLRHTLERLNDTDLSLGQRSAAGGGN
jgi:GntR family transcriptional repressor for pyruvate dehydrogenase complex